MTEITVIASLLVKVEHYEEIKNAFHSVVDESRREDGNISYNLHQNTKEPLRYIIIGSWKSQEAIDQHNTSIHFRRFLKIIEGKLNDLEIDVVKKVY